jgi:hypothetical protein
MYTCSGNSLDNRSRCAKLKTNKQTNKQKQKQLKQFGQSFFLKPFNPFTAKDFSLKLHTTF